MDQALTQYRERRYPMTSREIQKSNFLKRHNWESGARTQLASDASNRCYERLERFNPKASAILMDAPPQSEENTPRFIFVARFLRSLGLSAPEIFAQDQHNGFLILEDLGDNLVAKVLDDTTIQTTTIEHQIYETTVDALIHLHHAEPPDLDVYDPAMMSDLASLAFSEYRSAVSGHCPASIIQEFRTNLEAQIVRCCNIPHVLIQRDYHAENLLWLPDRDGIARVGMLDFQDALLGHPAYDLVSLLQDARRDVSETTEAHMLNHYMTRTGRRDDFRQAYFLLGIQRNLRIIGVFARLSKKNGKPRYIDLIPRVWAYLLHDLENSPSDDLADFIVEELPEPSPDVLNILRDQ